MKVKNKIVAWVCVLTLLVGCVANWGVGTLESKAADTADTGYTELTFLDFGLEDNTYAGTGANSAGPITSWDKVAINGTIALPASGGSYIRFGGAAVGNGVEIKYVEEAKLFMGPIQSWDGASEGLHRDDMGYESTDTVAGKEIAIRLTFDAVDNGANYLVTLQGTGTGEGGKTDTATMTLSAEKLTNYKVDVNSSATDKPVSIYSERIKTDKDTYTSEWETIPVTATSRSGDWVGIFEEDETIYSKGNATAWYNMADYNGVKYNMPAQEAGTYKIGVILNESTMLYSKTITVVQNEYKELTFSNFNIDDQTVNNNSVVTGSASLSSWDKVALSGIIALPKVGGSGYIRIAGDTVGRGICIKGTGGTSIQIGVTDANPQAYLQATDMGYQTDESLENEKIAIRLTFDAIGEEKYRVTLEGTGKSGQKGAVSIEVGESVFSDKMIRIQSMTSTTSGVTGEIAVSSTRKNVKVYDASYNIEKQSYLLTGNYEVTKDGQTVKVEESNPVLSTVGDYEVTTTWNGVTSNRMVSLFLLGDVDLNNSTILTSDDVEELKAILKGTKGATTAQEKAADLNNDGIVNNTDLKILQDIVEGKKEREAIISKYYPAAVRYEYLENGNGEAVMPIVGWEGVLSEDPNHYAGLKEAGINMILSNTGDYQDSNIRINTVLELAKKQGIGYLVKDNRIQGVSLDSSNASVVSQSNPADVKTMAQRMGSYSYFDSYLGNFVKDEPTLVREDGKYFTPKAQNQVSNFDHYEVITKQLNSFANTSGYVNLPAAVWWSGTDTSAGQNGNANRFSLTKESIEWYEKVVSDITNRGSARVLSFDRYVRGAFESSRSCPRYFLNLDIIRTQAKTSDIPFWSYVPVGEWTEGTSEFTRGNCEQEMYWAANTALAFGAKGIQYFTTTEPSQYSDDNYDMGIYNYNGDKNETWYSAVTRMNTLIQAVDNVLMKSENKGIIATGGNALSNAANIEYTEDGTTPLEMVTAAASAYTKDSLPNYSAIQSGDGVSRVKEIKTNNETAGAFAGVFDYQGKVALYIVNNDTENSQDITVTFTDTSNYRVVGFDTNGEIEDHTSFGISCIRNVGAGEAFLLIIDEENLETTTQYFDDISMYRVKDAYTAPELDGYVFAGWYKSEEAATKQYTYDTTTEATASDEEMQDALKEYKEFTFSDFDISDLTVTAGHIATGTVPFSSWDKVALSGIIALPQSGAAGYIRIAGDDTGKGIEIKGSGGSSIQFGVVGVSSSVWLQAFDMGYQKDDPNYSTVLVNEEIAIRLTFDAIGEEKYRVTLEGTGESGQKGAVSIEVDASVFYDKIVRVQGIKDKVAVASSRILPAYAKFVDESVLSVRAQLATGTTAESDKTSMRLVTTIDSLMYQSVGFKVCSDKLPNGMEKDITHVYRKIVATNGGIDFPYAPSVFDNHSQFLATVTVENLAVKGNTGKELRITPYWKTLDGTKVYGVMRTLTLQEGIDAVVR